MESSPQSAPHGYPSEHGGGGGAAPAPAGTGKQDKSQKIGPGRARTGLVVLFSFLLEFVVIAGYGNQYVTKHIREHVTGQTLGSHLYLASLSYNWRFTPPDDDSGHLWLAQLMLPVSFLVISALLVAVVVRGSVTFGRAFFGTWAVVLFATMAACYVRGAIADPLPGSSNRADSLLFSAGPNALTVLAGLALGLVVAFVVAILTVASRRPAPTALPPGLIAVPPPAEPDPDQPPPYFGATDPGDRSRPLYGDRSEDRPQPGGYHFEKDDARGGRHADDGPSDEAPAETTSKLPAVDDRSDSDVDADGQTRQLPAVRSASGSRTDADADGRTTQLPVVDADRDEPAARPVRDDSPVRDNSPAQYARPSEPEQSAPDPSDPQQPEPAAPSTHGRHPEEHDEPAGLAAEPSASEPAAGPGTPDAPTSEPAEPFASEPAEPSAPEPAEPSASEPSAQPAAPEPSASEPSAPQATGPEATRFAEPPGARRPEQENATTQFPRPPDDDDFAADHDLHQ